MNDEPIYVEKQYLGYNKYSLIRRMAFAIFCFLAYYFSDHEKVAQSVVGKIADIQNTSDLFFMMGIMILIWSMILIFILHIKTQIFKGYIVIDGLWTSRRVKIELSSIETVRIAPYSKYLLNRPVYNLHRKGRIKFFTRGNHAIELKDRDGLTYLIGTQEPRLLLELIQNQLSVVN